MHHAQLCTTFLTRDMNWNGKRLCKAHQKVSKKKIYHRKTCSGFAFDSILKFLHFSEKWPVAPRLRPCFSAPRYLISRSGVPFWSLVADLSESGLKPEIRHCGAEKSAPECRRDRSVQNLGLCELSTFYPNEIAGNKVDNLEAWLKSFDLSTSVRRWRPVVAVWRPGEVFLGFLQNPVFVSFFPTPPQNATRCHDGGSHLKALITGFPNHNRKVKSDLWLLRYDKNRSGAFGHFEMAPVQKTLGGHNFWTRALENFNLGRTWSYLVVLKLCQKTFCKNSWQHGLLGLQSQIWETAHTAPRIGFASSQLFTQVPEFQMQCTDLKLRPISPRKYLASWHYDDWGRGNGKLPKFGQKWPNPEHSHPVRAKSSCFRPVQQMMGVQPFDLVTNWKPLQSFAELSFQKPRTGICKIWWFFY